MRTLLLLLSILSSFPLISALDGIQRADWEENTEKLGQWYVEEEKQDLTGTDAMVSEPVPEKTGRDDLAPETSGEGETEP